MSEIKPVYQRRIQDDDWQEIEHSEYVEFSERGKFQTRILYPAAAYEALQKENAELKEAAKYAEHIDATPSNQRETMLYDTLIERDALKAESAAQAKRISDLENELVEFNEFKKIRDSQMQELRKQMP